MDLFVNAVLSASSVALFCYWFRYTCLLILAAETPRDYSEEVAESNKLAFLEVRAELRRHPSDLVRLHESLERDFAILAHVLDQRHAVRFDPRFEDVILTIHFRAMSLCFRLTRNNLQEFALDALEEMSVVVVHLANELGERQATAA